MSIFIRYLVAVLVLVGSAGALGQAPATPCPAKPVRIVVGFPPASGTDITARLIGPKLGEAFGQQFVIDNRPGAGSNIAAELTAKAAPDGYTIFIGTVANTINATLYAKLPFDFAHDFAPVALTTSAANVLVVHPSVPARSVAELSKLAKAQPGLLNFASSGTGTAPHLSGELFKSRAGVNIVHIPYKGSPQAVTDLIGGTPEQFATYIRNEIAKWARVIKESGARAE